MSVHHMLAVGPLGTEVHTAVCCPEGECSEPWSHLSSPNVLYCSIHKSCLSYISLYELICVFFFLTWPISGSQNKNLLTCFQPIHLCKQLIHHTDTSTCLQKQK